MDIKDYISSGIIESYVLGLASDEERAEFEQLCAANPVLREARDQFERALEQQAFQEAVQPPAHLKSALFSRLTTEEKTFSVDKEQASVIPMQRANTGFTWIRYIAAASIIFLLGSTALNFYFFSQYKKYSARYDDLVASQNQLVEANSVLQTRMKNYESAMDLLKDSAMAVVKMPGSPGSPSPASMATIYWNTKSKDVYLLVNNLPEPASEKQYQLWAIVDGKPVDAGVFDLSKNDPVIKMKNIPRAQAFAVTLEKRGGSPSPTMSAMYVLGKVNG